MPQGQVWHAPTTGAGYKKFRGTGEVVVDPGGGTVVNPTGKSLLQGVYRDQGAGGRTPPGGVIEYQNDFLGYPIDIVLTFIDEPTGNVGSPAWERWAGFRYGNWIYNSINSKAPGLAVQVGVGSFISSSKGRGDANALNLDGVRVGHDLVPTGVYDSHIEAQAKSLLANTPLGTDIYLRLNHEFNIDQFGHRAMRGREADFVASWRHYVNVQRAVDPERRIKYVWNPSLSSGNAESGWNVYSGYTYGDGRGWQSVNLDLCYPGDQYVDRIGPDCYDQGYTYYVAAEERHYYYHPDYSTEQNRVRNWARKRTGSNTPNNIETDKTSGLNCLNGIRDYALAGATRNGVPNCEAKPISFPEVGLWFNTHGGGDNPYFVRKLAEFVKKTAAVNGGDVSFWEHPGNGVFDPDTSTRTKNTPVPNARAEFLAQRPWRFDG